MRSKYFTLKFLIISFAVFLFLFFGFEAFAADPCKDFEGILKWQKESFSCDLTFKDTGGSLLKTCDYRLESDQADTGWVSVSGCEGKSSYTEPISVNIGAAQTCRVEGVNTCRLHWRAEDNAENTNSDTYYYDIDYKPPVTSIKCNDATCKSAADWYKADLSITLSCYDYPEGVPNSGCDKTYYCRDTTDSCDPTTVYTGAFDPVAEGISYVRFYSKDVAGNVETTKSQQIKWDKTPPIAGVDGAPADWVNM
jgi:hypothetical protein